MSDLYSYPSHLPELTQEVTLKRARAIVQEDGESKLAVRVTHGSELAGLSSQLQTVTNLLQGILNKL